MLIMIPEKVETERLLLVKPDLNPNFVRKLYKICSDDEIENVTKHMHWSKHENLLETKEIVEGWINDWNNYNNLHYKIHKSKDGKFIGMADLGIDNRKNIGHLGCWLLKDCWGKEYSKERALALIQLGFEKIGLNIIEVEFDKDNKSCNKSVRKYMSEVNGSKTYEYEDVAEVYSRKTVKWSVTNINYHDSGGVDVVKNYDYSIKEPF